MLTGLGKDFIGKTQYIFNFNILGKIRLKLWQRVEEKGEKEKKSEKEEKKQAEYGVRS